MKAFLLSLLLLLTIATNAQTNVPSYVPTNGLVGWWPFNGNANDESGNGNNGTVNGATLTTDRNGNVNSAYSFNGAGNYIGNSSNNLPNASRTISVWFYTNSLNGAQSILGYGGSTCGNSFLITLNHPNVINKILTHGHCWIDSLASSLPVNSGNQWFHLVISSDNYGTKHYLNGILTSSNSTYISSTYTLNKDFAIGSLVGTNGMMPYTDVGSSWWNGKLDDIGIWNRALTQQEITALYQSQSCNLSISSQPSNQTTTYSNNTSFTVGVTANNCSSPVTYQWQTNTGFGWQTLQNAGQYTGVNTSTLNVNNVGSTNTNQLFKCLIQSGSVSDTTQTATLTVVNNNSNLSGITHAIPYQAVVRDGNGTPMTNHPLTVRCSLHDNAATGTIIYQESHTITTNNFGLFTLQIGTGTATIGNIDSINWAVYKKFLQVEFDTTGQGNTFMDLGTQQLMSVPYALYAEHSGSSTPGPQGVPGPQGPQGIPGTNGINGATGPQGVPGNGFSNGTTKNQMMYWNDTSWVTLNPGNQGQTLTLCDGALTWTTGGQCPAKVGALNCGNATHTGLMVSGMNGNGTTTIPYTGGNGGVYPTQSISSTGVTGLTATLSTGTLNTGNGNLVLNITGTPTSGGTASFILTIGNQTCTFNRTIDSLPNYSCNPSNVFNPNLTYGSMSDQDGNIYRTIQIGTQEWMAENLRVGHYRNGDVIPVVPVDTNIATWLGITTGASCWYNNDSIAYNCTFGKLYNYYTVLDTREVCPLGWHVPSDMEWNILVNYLEPTADTSCMNCWTGTNVGGMLKSTQYWNTPNSGASNSSGFSALPSGYNLGGYNNIFTSGIGDYCVWWSSLGGTSIGKNRTLFYNSSSMRKDLSGNQPGLSVRCIKD